MTSQHHHSNIWLHSRESRQGTAPDGHSYVVLIPWGAQLPWRCSYCYYQNAQGYLLTVSPHIAPCTRNNSSWATGENKDLGKECTCSPAQSLGEHRWLGRSQGLLFGAQSTWVQILWMTFGSMILFHFHEKLYFTAQDTSSHHISVPCTK